MMSKKLTFKKADLAYAVKSFGYPNYDKRADLVRGKFTLLSTLIILMPLALFRHTFLVILSHAKPMLPERTHQLLIFCTHSTLLDNT